MDEQIIKDLYAVVDEVSVKFEKLEKLGIVDRLKKLEDKVANNKFSFAAACKKIEQSSSGALMERCARLEDELAAVKDHLRMIEGTSASDTKRGDGISSELYLETIRLLTSK